MFREKRMTSINWLGKKLGFNLKGKKIYLLD
ncbi:Uncharacterised protein [Sphingobacterium multivorum]|nr:Uncharacterised protein [Sphingobacterium multivorum]